MKGFQKNSMAREKNIVCCTSVVGSWDVEKVEINQPERTWQKSIATCTYSRLTPLL